MRLKQFSVTNEHCAFCWRTDPSFLEVLEVALAGSRISATPQHGTQLSHGKRGGCLQSMRVSQVGGGM